MRKLFFFIAALCVSIAVNATPISGGSGTLKAAVEAAADGAVIELNAGTYVEAAEIDFWKNLTIKAADMEHKPVVQAVAIGMSGGVRVKFEGIEFDAQDATDHLFFSYDETNSGNKLIFEGCEIYNYTNNSSLINCGYAYKLDSIVINDCYIHDIKKSFIFLENDGFVGLKITNSTFAKITTDKSDYWAGPIDVRAATAARIDVNNCTFYDVISMSSDYGAIGYREDPTSNVLIANSIFALAAANDEIRAIYVAGGEVKNCLTFNYNKDSGHEGVHSGPSRTACQFKVDPDFVNIATGYYLDDDSPAFEAGVGGTHLGDPRWWPNSWTPAAVIDVTSIELDEDALTLDVNETKYLVATVLPVDATDPSVNWVSSVPSVASVTNGAVKGLTAGTTVITATAGAFSATCTVTVSADLPSTDFATPYTCIATKAITENRVSLSGTTLVWNNNTDDSQNGIAKWRIHATKGAFLTATINNNASSTSGHCYKVEVRDADGVNLVGGTVEEPANSWAHVDVELSGKLLIPAAGDYTIVLKDSTNWSGSILDGITLTHVADVQKLYLTPDMWDTADPVAKFAIWDGTNSAWSHFMTLAEGESTIYETYVRADATIVNFARLNGALEEPEWGDGKKWNQTNDLTLLEGKDMFTITCWDCGAYGNSDGSWSKYTKTPTDVEKTEVTKSAQKLIENGQIVIIKNGVRYSVLGQIK